MVLFTIACETCASRLSVKQQAAIGQVLACPNCGSMVHVRPPEGWENPATQETSPKKPRPPRDPNDSQATLSAEFDNLATSSSPRRPLTTKTRTNKNSQSTPVISKSPPVQETVDATSTHHWDADGSGKKSNALAWIAGIIGICLVAFVLILFMVSQMMGGNDPTDPDQIAQNDVVDNSTKVEAANDKSPEQPPAQADEKNKVVGDDEKQGNASNENESEAVDGEANGNSESTSESESSHTSAKPDNHDPVLDENAALAASGDNVTMQQGDDHKSILEELAGISDLVFDPGVDYDALREVADDDRTHKYGIGKVFVPVPRKIDIDPVEAVNEIYPGLSYKDQPLIEFARNLFSLIQVPIQLDGQAIVEGRLDPLAKVNSAGKDISTSWVLKTALEPLGLTWKWNEDSSIIVITSIESDKIETRELPLDASLAIIDEESSDRLVKGIQFVIEPRSWNTKGGSGTVEVQDNNLVLEQTNDICMRVEKLIGSLALAAKLKSNPDDAALTDQISTAYFRSQDLLTSEGTVHSIQLVPIQSLLNDLQQQDGITVIVDWNELQKENWNPRTRIPWNAKGMSIEETLKELTNSMGLAYRLLDESTVQVTSRKEYWSQTRLEVYPCNKLLSKNYSGDQIIQFLTEGIASDRPEGKNTPVVFSPQYQCIIAVLPDPLHIRVEKILQQLANRE